jgi:uncharacterized membrane protein YdjX (TVP38/TMEM64 family)
MLKEIYKEYIKAHPVKKFFIFLWAFLFITGIIFSTFYLVQNGFKESFTALFGSGVSMQTVIVFLSVFVFRTLFFIPVSVLMFTSPFIFEGFWLGVLMSGIGEIIGAIIGFIFARYYVQELFQSLTKENRTLVIISEKLEFYGGMSIAILRLSPLTFDLINFAAGMSKMKFSIYLLSTSLSVWVDCFIYVSLGYSVNSPSSLFYTVTLGIILLIGIYILKKHPHYKNMFVMDTEK